ncbi:MAG: PAS domain S-box protein, partial [Anaerolineaceae bacterium]|nr:PAS domain S-box protein [Anaerolineaceae bacterium]
LWVAYDRPHNFSEEEIRFLSTLAGEASLAATSARLYATAEVGRQRLEAVLASTPEPVLVIDEQARLLLLNPAAVQVSGLIVSAVEGRFIQETVGSQDLIQLLKTPSVERISSREINLPNGKIYYASVSPVVAEGRAVGKVCILRDITHFKELEQLKSDFVATVSHDLRSPLTLMRGYATMLQMVGDLNEQQKGYVRKIVSGVENMSRLVSNLLDLGRIEAGIGLQIEKVIVREIIEEVLNSLQLQATQKDIRLFQETTGQNKRYEVDADRALLQQAMYNLVENAIKYTPVSGQVKVKLEFRINSNSMLMEVQDTGIGIAPLDLPHLFEKFYRSGRREAYQQRGTGLGLAIVKSIAERHGGRVWVDSQLGKGSVFSLEMPCEQPEKVEGEIEKFS